MLSRRTLPIMSMSNFVHLHCHSEHSYLDGVPVVWNEKKKRSQLLERVAELEQPAIALTDHGEVSGHLRLQKACDYYKVKPIFGIESYFIDDRRVKNKDDRYDHITVLAKNKTGLRNLWALSSRAWTEGHYYKPRCDWELLQEYKEGLIVTGGCLGGVVTRLFREALPDYNPDRGLERLLRLYSIFGDDFFLELHTFADDEAYKVNQQLIELGNEFGIPLIACSDAHYLRPDDWEDHEVLTAAQMGLPYDSPKRYQFGPNQLHIHSEGEVRQKLSYLDMSAVDEAIKNTNLVERRCGAVIEGVRAMPVFLDTQRSDDDALRRLAWKLFDRRMEKMASFQPGSVPPDHLPYHLRLERELDLICSKGFSGYFLVVADMVDQAKKMGLLVGPSRGSVGGSLLAYVLGITEVDPLIGDLLFERFLTPDRTELPDIDIDFPQLERDQIRSYLAGRYHMATIGTLSILKPKRLVRDFCKVLKIPIPDMNAILRIVDSTVASDGLGPQSWKDVYELSYHDLKSYEQKHPRLFRLLNNFADHIRHAGGHPSAVILSKDDLIGKIPLRVQEGDVRTQFDMHDVEELGFVKFDVLGVRTLSTLMRAYDLVKQRHADHPPHFYEWAYDWNRFYGDTAVYRSMWSSRNIGIFQVEAPQMNQFAGEFKPENFQDLVDMISINRPGITRAVDEETGMNLRDILMAKREGRMEVRYKHPKLESILASTYGQPVYQEQVMRIAQELAGYSLADADRVRKIIGKKKQEQMLEERARFVQGCVENSIDSVTAHSIFDDLEEHGSYSFNRSHAWGYAMISTWCLWLKHYYPTEFMTACLQTNDETTAAYLRECKRLGIPVQGPDINESDDEWTLIDEGVIRCGLNKVKWVAGVAKLIKGNRPYSNCVEFFDAIPKKTLNKRAMLALIRVGALDSLMTPQEQQRFTNDFGDVGDWCPTKMVAYRFLKWRADKSDDWDAWCAEYKWEDRGFNETELLDAPISVDPFGLYIELLARECDYTSVECLIHGQLRKLGGIIRRVRPTEVKNGDHRGAKMCQLWLERPLISDDDRSDWEQVVVFPKEFARYSDRIEVGAPVLAKVQRVDKGDGIMLKQMWRLDWLDK